MLTPESPPETETCPFCQFQREIVAIKFPLFRAATALFVCPSCGSACAEPNALKNNKPARLRRQISAISPVAQARPDAPASATDSVSEAVTDTILRRSQSHSRKP
jgi:uncharacterized Zn finger protein (UPF0148 family)